MNEIMQKTRMGIPLDDIEYKKLLIHLGFKNSLLRTLLLIFLFLLAIFAAVYLVYLGRYTQAIFTTILYLVLHFSLRKAFVNASINLQNYLKSLNDFYDDKFSEYIGYYIFRTPNIIVPEERTLNPDVLFLSNGYQFVIFNDFLKSTEFEIHDKIFNKGERHFLRILDQESIHNVPLVIRPEDISNYFEVAQTKSSFKTDYGYKNHTLKFPVSEYKNYVEILLIDNSVLRLGKNILDLLRVYIPTKEVRKPI